MQLSLLFIILAARFQAALTSPAAGDPEQSKSPEPRALPPALFALPSLLFDLIPQFINLANEEEAECGFVGEVVEKTSSKYPDMNVVIFKDQSASTNGLREASCLEQDLPLAFFRTKTYKICVFRQGKFVRAGEGGCRNWGFGKCSRRILDRTVSFCIRSTATTAFQSSTVTIRKPPPTTQVRVSSVTITQVSTTTARPVTRSTIQSSFTVTQISTTTARLVTRPTTQDGVTITQILTTTARLATEPTTQGSAGSTIISQANVPRVTQPVLAAAAGGFAVVALLMP